MMSSPALTALTARLNFTQRPKMWDEYALWSFVVIMLLANDQAQGPPPNQTGDHAGQAANRQATPIEAAGGGSLGRLVRG